MAPSDANRREWERTPLWYSVARSLVTPHWVFTLVLLSVTLWGVALAPAPDWRLTGVLLVALYLGVEGMHDIDLADPEVAVDLDPRVQRITGRALVGTGLLLGLYAAYVTTWEVAVFLVVLALAGLAYTAEWFDGLFHDLDRLGWATAAVVLGVVPVVLGHYLHARSITPLVILWGAVAALYAVGILHLYQVVKVPVLYDRIGIRHVRTMEMGETEAYRMVTTGLLCVILGKILMGVAFVAMTVGS